MDDFRRNCREFDTEFFGGEEELAAATIPDIEEAFWRMVEEGSGSGKSVDVQYGADVDTSVGIIVQVELTRFDPQLWKASGFNVCLKDR